MIQPVRGGRELGHLSVIVDLCRSDSGERRYLFADGYTPARVPVIRLQHPGDPKSAWMTVGEYQWHMRQFGPGSFHRFPGWPERR